MSRSSIATPLEGSFVRRCYKEEGGKQGSRSAYQRDRDRILYSRAFRRLMHKTQVFVAPQGDHFRTRLTHTLEVAQIARSLARAIGVDEDLTEAIALAHDLGHPPFGHVGEEELDKLMREEGDNPNGFDHNIQTLRLVTKLEIIGQKFDGLNLTAATLEGLLKHHGVTERKKKNDKEKLISFFPAIESMLPSFDFDKPASLEAQCACVADEIAYSHHDLEDGLRAQLITLPEVCDEVEHIKKVHDSIDKDKLPNDETYEERLERRLISSLIGMTIEDTIRETKHLIQKEKISSITGVQNHDEDIVNLSTEQFEKNNELKNFLEKSMYHHKKVIEEGEKGRHTVRWLFRSLPDNSNYWNNLFWKRYNLKKGSRALSDYIAGMTDNYAYKVRDAIGGILSAGIEETGGKHSSL